MSNKNLLNEAQVRQFMKLASLQPLTPGFVTSLTEKAAFKRGEETEVGGKADESPTKGQKKKDGGEAYVKEGTEEELDELRTGVTGRLGPAGGTANPGHGRGQGEAPDGSLFQEEDLEAQEDDLGDAEADMDHAEDLEDDAGEDLGDIEGGDEGRMVSVDAFLAALESALESAMGDEVEVDASEMEDEAGEEFAPEGEDVVADVEVEDEVGLEEASFVGASKAREKLALGKKGSYAPDPEEGEEEWKGSAPGAKARRGTTGQRIGAGRASGKAPSHVFSPKIGENTQSHDDLVEQITKRVAARILKSALSNKK